MAVLGPRACPRGSREGPEGTSSWDGATELAPGSMSKAEACPQGVGRGILNREGHSCALSKLANPCSSSI